MSAEQFVEACGLKRSGDPHGALVVPQYHRNDLAGGRRQIEAGANRPVGMRAQGRETLAQVIALRNPVQRGGHRHRHQRRRGG